MQLTKLVRPYIILFCFLWPALLLQAAETKKPAPKPRPWYIYNSVQVGSFATVFLPDSNAQVTDTSFTRNFLFVSYQFNPNWVGFVGFGMQLFESDITNPTAAERLGDSLFGAGYRFWSNAYQSLGLSLAAKVPLSDYPIENLSAQGDGQVDIKAALKHKIVFTTFSLYSELETKAGHNFRFASPADQLELSTNYHLYLYSFFAIRVGAGYTHSYDGTDYGSREFSDVFRTSGPGDAFISLRTRYFAYRFGFDVIPMKSLLLSFTFSQVATGENAANVRNLGFSAGNNF